MIIADSSVWIDYFNGNASRTVDRLDALLGVEMIAVGDLILTEVLQGFRRDRDFAQARAALLSLPVLPMVGSSAAFTAARHFRHLRSRGIAVRKTVDVLIATCDQGHALLYDDRDFDPFVEHLGLTRA